METQQIMERIITIFKANFEKMKADREERTAKEKALHNLNHITEDYLLSPVFCLLDSSDFRTHGFSTGILLSLLGGWDRNYLLEESIIHWMDRVSEDIFGEHLL
jgi:hypothetical protein